MTSPFDILLQPSNQDNTHEASVKLVDQAGHYTIGPPTRPPIKHDNGFLDAFPRREPTASDRLAYAKWVAMLEGSEALCSGATAKFVPACHGEDLTDANGAYRHFLFGNGTDRTINYERFLQDDASGQQVVPNLLNDFVHCMEVIGKDRVKFSVTSTPYSVGMGGIASYPATANWQKAIGAHVFWVSADVTASANAKGEIIYSADLTIHMEDRYNFNPGMQDVATGIPDSANGRFEITGLAKQYTNYATVTRHVSWAEGSWNKRTVTGAPTDRQRKPQDSRRLRNKI
ncbi:hypothetical protein [Duganella callida]|uniref:Uncharacterized protein n=1 Tax=Duganella callida TaxID=2561932 RepID=A0A4Y9SAD8_9BURK|nr:hypothetical protein [Duganella callida]TFW18574.1 hypothetical protein E4L98_18030 [Duganella callida]